MHIKDFFEIIIRNHFKMNSPIFFEGGFNSHEEFTSYILKVVLILFYVREKERERENMYLLTYLISNLKRYIYPLNREIEEKMACSKLGQLGRELKVLFAVIFISPELILKRYFFLSLFLSLSFSKKHTKGKLIKWHTFIFRFEKKKI